jgi:two-component system sensor histidine kinase BaeS
VLRERYRDARPVGSGLGLSIAARLVQRMGGTISAHSRDGGGAVFRVAIPA